MLTRLGFGTAALDAKLLTSHALGLDALALATRENEPVPPEGAARLADVPLEDFRALNPSLNRPVILAAGTPEILLPWDTATVFKRNFEAHNAGQYASWTAWSVPSNMSVAEAARRVGMSETELRSINSIPPRMLITAGSVLMVSRSARDQDDVDYRPRVRLTQSQTDLAA